ncbi:MAG: glycosyltransferase [Burkholderiales bacterium]|jgi:glycosyltransferase involved in cell wall biosynthesis
MLVLFIHQNFPGQFLHLAPEFARRGHRVVALVPAERAAAVAGPLAQRGVEVEPYELARGSTPGVHRWIADFETKVIRGEACFRAALALRARGLVPDVVVAHPGWGESLMLREVWPSARIGLYCEFHYSPRGLDVGFDPEFAAADPGDACRVRLMNLNATVQLGMADAGLSPTRWQADTFPPPLRAKISVAHDGIDTDVLAPDVSAAVNLSLPDGRALRLTREDEVVTFVNRNLEPYRGYHVFMRALPELLARRPRAQVVLVGGDASSYGPPPDPARWGARSWRQIFAEEVRPRIADSDWPRVHFVGRVPHAVLTALMRITSAHVYLTYPFVLSWSLIEAMSVGCPIVGSDTGPVREVIEDGRNGVLVDFFDARALAARTAALLDDADARRRFGERAREDARERYDLRRVCLPAQLRWVEALAG